MSPPRAGWTSAPPDGIPTAETALRSLSAKTIRPVYFLVGDQPWIQARLAARIRELTVPEDWRSMNAETVWADEVPEGRVADAASTPPFGSPRRFVLCRGVEAYRGGAPSGTGSSAADDADEEAPAAAPRKRRSKASKSEATPLVDYVSRPSPDTVLVLTSEKRDLKWWAGDALFEAAEAAGAVVACLPPADLRGWLAEQAAGLGAKLEPAAAEELVERAGADPLLLLRELEKLSAYVGGPGIASPHGVSASAETPRAALAAPITVEHVQALTGETAPPSVFAYLDALFVERQPARALSLLARLLEESHPLALHAMLLGQLRKLVALKGALAAGLTDWQIVGKIRLPFALVGSLKMMVGRTRPERFAALLRALAQAERELKRGREGRAVLEDLTIECCR
ncbi:MAG: hypothetical protein AAB152_04750 [Candidatus Coatesbacteria bacterium]